MGIFRTWQSCLPAIVLLWLGNFTAAGAGAPVEMQGKGCLAAECHGALAKQKFVHAPVSQGDCQHCHVMASAAGQPPVHKFQTHEPNLATCGECHKPEAAPHKVVHAPFKEKCSVCHDSHGGNARFYFTGGLAEDLCLRCHAKVLENKQFVHAPVALKACLGCHAPHSSDEPGLLARPREKLCVYCHSSFQSGMDKAVSVHAPAREACFNCHDPHGGLEPGFLPAAEEQLCQRCHAEMMEKMKTAAYPHKEMIAGKACSTCHDPHWSASAKLLKQPSIQICLQCHDKAVKAADGREIEAIGRQIVKGASLHGPIQQQDCTPCHAVHGSQDPRLMMAAFPQGFYVHYELRSYALCFGCHDPKLAEEEETLATGFRNGEHNLHWVHVHQDKGRSCRACHHEHASQEPFHIRDWVPYGQWKLKVQLKVTPTGGTCEAGCHLPRAYDREHPLQDTAAVDTAAPGRDLTQLQVGAPAPGLALPTLDGPRTTCTLAFGGGNTTLLALVRTDQRFTSETEQMCRRLGQKFAAADKWQAVLVWVGRQPEKATPLGAPWRVLHDEGGQTGRDYRIVASPTIYVIGPQGTIAHVYPGWNPLLETRLTENLSGLLGVGPGPEEQAAEHLGPQERAALFFNLGRAMAARGFWREALVHYDRGLGLGTPTAQALSEAARAAFICFDQVKARKYAGQALAIDPRHGLALAVMDNLEGRPASLAIDLKTSEGLAMPAGTQATTGTAAR